MAIGEVVAGQFARAWETLVEAIHQFPAEQWRTGETETLIPARLAYHLIEAAEFYSGTTSEGFAWGRRFGADWEGAEPDQLPTQEQVLIYLEETQTRVDAWLRGMADADLLAADSSFLWTGSTTLDRALYLLRHNQHHVGELNAELRRRRLPRAEWR